MIEKPGQIYFLCFPGQYFDQETGLHYNYFRDYDPSTGRFVESDPIGLRGGVNTFVYSHSNPLNHIDPFGLKEVVIYKFESFFWDLWLQDYADPEHGLTGSNYKQITTIEWTGEVDENCELSNTTSTRRMGPWQHIAGWFAFYETQFTTYTYTNGSCPCIPKNQKVKITKGDYPYPSIDFKLQFKDGSYKEAPCGKPVPFFPLW